MRTHYELALSLGPLSSSNLDSEPLEWIDACLDRNLQVVKRETPIRNILVLITNASAHSSRRVLTLHLKSGSCSLSVDDEFVWRGDLFPLITQRMASPTLVKRLTPKVSKTLKSCSLFALFTRSRRWLRDARKAAPPFR